MRLGSVSQGNRNKNKNKQMAPNQTYKLLHSEGNHTHTHTHTHTHKTPMEWEKIFANDVTDKDLISKIYKQLIQLNNDQKTAQSKNGQKI